MPGSPLPETFLLWEVNYEGGGFGTYLIQKSREMIVIKRPTFQLNKRTSASKTMPWENYSFIQEESRRGVD